MSNLRVWYNLSDYVVAESAEKASQVWGEALGEDPGYYGASDWEPLPDKSVLECVDEYGNALESKACAEWAKGEPRYLGSRDY